MEKIGLNDEFYIGNSNTQLKDLIKSAITVKATSNKYTTTTANYQHVNIEFDTATIIGNKLNFDNANNAIIIGKGVSKVTVSANCSYMWDTVVSNEVTLAISKNDVTTIGSITNHQNGEYTSNSISPIDIDVKEGDIIKLFISIGAKGKVGYSANTYMRVEVI